MWATCDVNDRRIVEEVGASGRILAFGPLLQSWLILQSLMTWFSCMQVYQLLTMNYVEDDDNMFRCRPFLSRGL